LAKEFSIDVEDLDAAVAAIGDVNVVVRIDGDAVRSVELAGWSPGSPQNLSQLPSLSILAMRELT